MHGHLAGHTGAVEHHSPLDRIAHHLGLALTLGYALLSCVGVVFETLLLQKFDTDFLAYAEPEDFLMAGLRHPIVLLFVAASVASLLAVYGLIRVGRRVSSRFDEYRSRGDASSVRQWVRKIAAVFMVGYYFFLFTKFYARYEANSIRAGQEASVALVFQQSGDAALTPPLEGQVVAGTGRYLFFYEKAAHRMHVVPTSAVRQISTPAGH